MDASATSTRREGDPVRVVGAGVAGTWTALALAEAGLSVTLYDRDPEPKGTSHWAGGMLAPGCESDGAEPSVIRLGRRSLELWKQAIPEVEVEGSLVVAHPRDETELVRFGRQTIGGESVDGRRIAELEPLLEGRFRTGLFYAGEGHVEPRRVLPLLRERLRERGVAIRFGEAVDPASLDGTVVDCRGLGARDALPDLRGVKGETVLLASDEITLNRPVRVMHPRWPIYVIPRPDGRFLIGASQIESEDASGVTMRSALELMTAAYALHPAFGEAKVVELGTALRPAFPDHAPRIEVRGPRITVNGLHRHGFLVAPALAEIVTEYLVRGARDNEVMRWS